jgi:hypothetical protein
VGFKAALGALEKKEKSLAHADNQTMILLYKFKYSNKLK